MEYVVLVHILAIAFWLGVFSVELVIERARVEKAAVARLHKLTDKYVEGPVITVIFISGFILWAETSFALELLPKVLCGAIAIVANAVCMIFVIRRDPTDRADFSHNGRLIYKSTLIGTPFLLAALVLGITGPLFP